VLSELLLIQHQFYQRRPAFFCRHRNASVAKSFHRKALGERNGGHAQINHNLRTWMRGSTNVAPNPLVNIPTQKICVVQSKNLRFPMNSDPKVLFYTGNATGTMLFNDYYFASEHPNGANFMFADGSVHFMQEKISIPVYEELGTIAGGEPIRH